MSKVKYSVKGKSTKELLNIDLDTFNKLKSSELRQIVSRLSSTANKRLRRFKDAGENSPAVGKAMKSGGRFTTRGKNLNELRKEFVRVKMFLEARSGNLKDWRDIKARTIESLKDEDVVITSEQFDDFWDIFEKLRERHKEISYMDFKYTVEKEIVDTMKEQQIDIDAVIEALSNKISDIYKEELKKYARTGVSGFFTVD